MYIYLTMYLGTQRRNKLLLLLLIQFCLLNVLHKSQKAD